jgi:ricin-type beta-trefoil lectin protein/lysozyme-like protein
MAAVTLSVSTPAQALSRPRPPATISYHVPRLPAAAMASAAQACAVWASDAGFANNGYMGGALTTAVAIAMYESGCNQAACNDDTTMKPCTQKTETPGDEIDRGAWQLNNKVTPEAPDACAYQGQCSADWAYVQVSADGTDFNPWSSYDGGHYASLLWPAQQAVSSLRQGTITEALIGSCLGYPSDRRGAPVRQENCGAPNAQVWRMAGSSLRTTAGLCLAATSSSRNARVELARCSGSTLQRWEPRSSEELYNPGSRRCLANPAKGAIPVIDKPGFILETQRCAVTQEEVWFEP